MEDLLFWIAAGVVVAVVLAIAAKYGSKAAREIKEDWKKK